MSAATDNPTDRRPRPERQDDAPDTRQAERFRATARHIATQLDIEATMWQLLGKEPER